MSWLSEYAGTLTAGLAFIPGWGPLAAAGVGAIMGAGADPYKETQDRYRALSDPNSPEYRAQQAALDAQYARSAQQGSNQLSGMLANTGMAGSSYGIGAQAGITEAGLRALAQAKISASQGHQTLQMQAIDGLGNSLNQSQAYQQQYGSAFSKAIEEYIKHRDTKVTPTLPTTQVNYTKGLAQMNTVRANDAHYADNQATQGMGQALGNGYNSLVPYGEITAYGYVPNKKTETAISDGMRDWSWRFR